MNYWLVKSEPVKYAWDQLVKDGKTFWNGVRNYQASNNLKAMKKGDQAFFYHSNEGLEIVGICEIAKEYYPDHTDESGRFGMVDVKPARPLKNPVTLAAIKAEPTLADISLIKQSRLSVMPITPAQWKLICKMGGIKP
ncbi:EVE domain-containing protein [Dongia mobilis]|jgi:predicted RNA-binding protein with PUA-like domain|uniref:EVE domain-containing protein n=1 Tax=Dongia sp. TaxID=1977262 RepID=UPI0026EEB15E